MKLMLSRSILLIIFVSLMANSQLFALDEEALCTGNNRVWNSMFYQCSIIDSGTNVAGVNWRYDVDYPTEIFYEPFVQTEIDTVLGNAISEFETEVSNFADPNFPLSLLIQIDVYRFDLNVFTTVFHIQREFGGPNPFTDVFTITFDLESNTILVLEDLFISGSDPLSLIVPHVRSELYDDFNSDPSLIPWIDSGTEPLLSNYEQFAMTEDSLIFFFREGQVAPFVAGGRSARVPLSLLSAIWQIGDNANPVLKG